jgi:hypothetical protein
VTGIVGCTTGLLRLGLGIGPCTLDTLLSKADQADSVSFLGKHRMRFFRMGGGSLGLVVASKPFVSVSNCHLSPDNSDYSDYRKLQQGFAEDAS